MRILELHIKNFGKFSDKKIRFDDGINILYGRNESGKSTIQAFIRAMLFGLEKSRGRAAKNDEYELRKPWENPGYFAGTMRFESGGKVFRLERNFDRKEKSASLICETDGEELSLERGDLEVLLEGMNETAYRNTYLITQQGAATAEGLAQELQNYMGNLQNAGDAQIDVARATAVLGVKRKKAEAEKKKRCQEMEDAAKALQLRTGYVQQETERLRAEEEAVCHRLSSLAREEQWLNGCDPERREAVSEERKFPIALVLLGAAVCLSWLFLPHLWMKLAALAVGLLSAGVLLKFSAEQDDQESEESREEWQRKRRQLFHEIEKQKGRLGHIRSELREKQAVMENLKESRGEALAGQEEIASIEREIEALKLAAERIEEASKEVYGRWEGRLNSHVSEILEGITEGRYTSIFLDEDLCIRINTPEKLLDIRQVSRGTMEQIYFALRMAAGEILSGGENVPVILDEAFAMYDDERLCRTLRWLEKSKKQVILFTCQQREPRILERIRAE